MNKNQRNKNRKKTKKNQQNLNSKISNKIDSNNELLNEGKNIIETSKKMVYPTQLGETISKIIVEKLIAITIRICEDNERKKKYKNYYFDYIINQMDKLFSVNSIFHTEEPENYENDNYLNNYKICYNKSNTWVEIKEPNSSKCDRFEGLFVKHIPIESDNNQITDDIIDSTDKIDSSQKQNQKNNNKNNIKDKRNKKKKTLKYYKNNLESLEEIGSDSGEEEQARTKEKKLSIVPHSPNKIIKELDKPKNNIIEQGSSFEKTITKKKKYEKVEFKSEDIPGLNEELNIGKYDPPEIEMLREKIEKEMIEKKEQINKNLNMRKYSFFNKVNISNGKIFDSEKLTFDSNGEIIKFKPLKINLLGNDFQQLKYKLDMLKPLPKMPLTKKNFQKMQKLKRSSSIKTKEKLKIIKNPADDPDVNKGIFIKITPEKKNKVIQSGNNFNLMLPNVGVVLKDEQTIKKGDRNFSKFFNKYSLSDFDKILKEYLPKENKELFQKQMRKMNSTSFLGNNNFSSSINNSNFYNNSFDFPNPLTNLDNKENETNLSNLNSVLANKNNLNIMNKNSSNNFKNATMNHSSSFINNIFNNSSTTNMNNKLHNFYQKQNGFIRLNNVSSSSLKLELDSLNDLDNKYRCLSPENTRTKLENIFTRKYKEIFKNDKKENEVSKDLNDLNKEILNSKNWGNNNLKKYETSQNLLISKKQNKSQIFKIIGNKMLNKTKFRQPRERKVKIFI